MSSAPKTRFSTSRAYWTVYALLVSAAFAVAATGAAWAYFRGAGLLSFLSLAPLAVLGVAFVRRVLEFRAYRHIPGPRPSFFLGNLPALLANDHGGRDQALVELHRIHGPVLRLHLAWGSTPFVSLSRVSPHLSRRDIDSNRRADGRVLGKSLMGMKMGAGHLRHRKEVNSLFTPAAVRSGVQRMASVSQLYLQDWKTGENRHGNLKSDLHHWSAHSLGVFLCGEDWQPGTDLKEYLASIAALEESISVDAFHPWFARWLSPARRTRVQNGYQFLFELFVSKLQARRNRQGVVGEDALGRMVERIDEWGIEECAEEMISLVAGGTDAMSYTTAQALVLLSQNPGALGALAGEIAESSPAAPIPGAQAVIAETMRLFPAVPFSSKVVPEGGITEEGLAIPAGANLMWMKTAIGRNPDVFPEPERFLPSRFSDPADYRESMAKALPFGAGPRHCPGRNLAETLCASFVAAIVRDFDVQPVELDAAVQFSATVSVTPSVVPVRLAHRPRSSAPTLDRVSEELTTEPSNQFSFAQAGR